MSPAQLRHLADIAQGEVDAHHRVDQPRRRLVELEIIAARPLAGGAARVTRAAVGFALMLTAITLGLVNIALLEAKPINAGLPVVRSDFPLCVRVNPGPVQRPDHSTTNPHGRKADNA